jgi:membrane-associated phospholipid phosphatase
MPREPAARHRLQSERPQAATSRLEAVDRLTIGYLAFTLSVILLRSSRIPHALALFGLNAGLLLAVWVVAGARSRGGVLGVLAEWYPLPLFVIFFEEIGSLVHALVDGWFDPWLIETDRLLFGRDLSVWLESFGHPWLTEAMQFAYFSYFPLTAGVAAYLWFGRERDGFRLLMLASAITYYGCYLVFLLFPIESPFHTLRHLQRGELEGRTFTSLMNWIERYGRVHGGAFPSAHVAGSVVTLLAAWRFAPVLGLCLTPLVALLVAATIYGRYHYGVDAIAGVLAGALGFAAAIRVERRRPDMGEQES